MRRIEKRHLIELIETLNQACETLMRQEFNQTFVDLCADIQDFISGCFDYLMGCTGKETETAGKLQQMYEKLLFVSRGEAGPETLKSCVCEIAACARDELHPDKIEAAFFCYKASMSDCLESIYRAAKEDPSCDAYFIPIPYYDRNPDFSLGQLHYEGEGCYPDTYELTDWQEYDVKARQPDIIFIMNPYDECNRVTSVHPDFYAAELRKFTDLLVYVPYFLEGAYIEPVSVISAGVVYADRTIVQSEDARKQYIEILSGKYPAIERDVWQEKITALGTPKADSVLLAKRDFGQLPDAWRAKLEEGAPGRKVLLYNLSIGMALNLPDYVKKLRSVIELLKDREDVLLWWRPHPLLEDSLALLRRGFLQDYKALVKEYREGQWGIYDDSEDFTRAITFADAGYGDIGSLNFLLQMAGKPVMIQNTGTAGKEPGMAGSREDARASMERFIEKESYDCYMLYESDDTTGDMTLIDYISHLDVIKGYEKMLGEKYRAHFANADGSAGKKIYDAMKQLL